MKSVVPGCVPADRGAGGDVVEELGTEVIEWREPAEEPGDLVHG